jgi:hypothetical protein
MEHCCYSQRPGSLFGFRTSGRFVIPYARSGRRVRESAAPAPFITHYVYPEVFPCRCELGQARSNNSGLVIRLQNGL